MDDTERQAHQGAVLVLLRTVSDTVAGERDRCRSIYDHAHALWRDADVGESDWLTLADIMAKTTVMYHRARSLEEEHAQLRKEMLDD